eukprot:SAG11_NODE_968_length_6354_cov_16.546922_1_plen_165_part_00
MWKAQGAALFCTMRGLAQHPTLACGLNTGAARAAPLGPRASMRTIWRVATAVGVGGTAAAAATAASVPSTAQTERMSQNRIIGGPGAKHRVAITSWPIVEDPDKRLGSAAELFDWARSNGYDGLELTVSSHVPLLLRLQCWPRTKTRRWTGGRLPTPLLQGSRL